MRIMIGSYSSPLGDGVSASKRKVNKSCAAAPIRSYSDIALIKDYFLKKRQYRDLMLFMVGLSTGLRISDLVSLRFCDLLNNDLTYKNCISLREKKTKKPTVNQEDEVLITESVIKYVDLYLSTINFDIELDEWMFKSQRCREKKGDPLYGEYVISEGSAHRIMKKMQRDLELPYNVGSHTMRKSFATILYHIILNSSIQANISAASLVQIALRHKDVRTTMSYLGMTKNMMSQLRCRVSDFVLGKTDMDVLGEEIQF